MPAKKKKSRAGSSRKSGPLTQKITKEMTLGEVVSKYPKSISVMLNYGMHCIGCGMAVYETIEQGASAHGLDPKTIEKMVKEMNSALK
jgi:hybrid cluster-associated redox disulfide protein